jgi:hypothetical protein
LRGSLPKNSFTLSCTLGMRVWPPTRMTSLTLSTVTSASLTAVRQGGMVFSIRSITSDSNLARVIFIVRCRGPDWSAVM